MAILEMTISMTYYGQRCLNRFNYIASGTPAAVSLPFGLASAFGAVFAVDPPLLSAMALWLPIVSPEVVFDQVLVKNVYDPTTFYETPFVTGVNGLAGGESLSPTQALAMRTNRTRLDIRRGMKRFVGVTANFQDPGGTITASALPAVEAFAAELSNTLEYDDEGNTLSYEPVVVGKEAYVTPSGRTAYRYYATEAEQLDHVMDSIAWEPYDTVRTQNSRQYGRGT